MSGILGGKANAVELCNLVLTTSKGHVTIAPAVPAVLWITFLFSFYLFIYLIIFFFFWLSKQDCDEV